MCSVLALVTIYYPDKQKVKNNILKYADLVDTLVVWDNTPGGCVAGQIVFDEPLRSKVLFKSTGRNEGIAYPVNLCMEMAEENGYDLLLIMDQDSVWLNFDVFISKVKELFRKGVGGIFIPNIHGIYNYESRIVERIEFINSGTFFSVGKALSRLGPYNERLFLDGLDLDYSLRAKLAGIDILCLTDCRMHQQFGDPIKSEVFKCASNNYSADRTYNIVRNHMVLLRKYGKHMSGAQKKLIINGYILKRLAKVVLLEPDKVKKIKAITKGVAKGLTVPLTEYFQQNN